MPNAFRINTNIQAQQAFQNLQQTNDQLSSLRERLTTGKRINEASDDAAGFQIANQLEAKTGGQEQALRNIGDAKSTLSTAEGALNSQLNILQTAKEKATQAANGSLTDSEKSAIQNELDQLTSEVQDIAENTEFNGQKLLQGGKSGGAEKKLSFQTGAGAKDQFDVSISNSEAVASDGLNIGSDASQLVTFNNSGTATGTQNLNVDSGDFASLNTTITDGSGDTLDASTGTGTGNIVNGTGSDVDNGTLQTLGGGEFNLTVKQTGSTTFEVQVGGDSGATSTIKAPSASGSIGTGTATGSGSVTLEKDTESGDTLKVDLSGTSASNLTDVTGGTGGTGQFSVTVGGEGVEFSTDVTKSDSEQSDSNSLSGAQEAINQIDSAINKVTSQLSDLGSTQNRLSFKESNLKTTKLNLEAAQSRIEDANFARTQTQVAKLQVQQQSGTAQLAQANAAGQSVLSLLQG